MRFGLTRQPPTPAAETGAILRNIHACFFLSGGLGLVYQILWLRKLLLVFGSTVHAVSTVLTVFFSGLALGSWLLGRLIDRHPGAGLRWYGMLEMSVGAYAFVTLPLFDLVRRIYVPIYRASDFSPQVLVGATFACSALVLLLPAILLGATFPVLSRFLIRSSQARGTGISNLYAINTAGAMLGTLGVYFLGLPMLGLARSLMCAGVLNLGIGMLCLAFDRHLGVLGFAISGTGEAPVPSAGLSESGRPQDLPPVASAAGGQSGLRAIHLAFGLSGFAAMAYEVTWTRALSLVVGSSIYAFCLTLATFLGGIAAGSWLYGRRRNPGTVRQFLWLEVALGAYGLAVVAVFARLPDWFVTLWPLTRGTFHGTLGLQAAMSIAVMALPTLLLGLLFPLVTDLVTTRWAALGRSVGAAYAVNTFGGILGSFAAGFLLVPQMGLAGTMVFAGGINLLAAAVLAERAGEPGAPRRLAAGLAVTAVVLTFGVRTVLPAWKNKLFAAGAYLNPRKYAGGVEANLRGVSLLYYRDGLNATVTVHRSGPWLFLKVGGKTDASNSKDMPTQVLSAHLPLLLHGHAKTALVIGLGSGVTLGHASRYPLTLLHCAEIEPAVIEGARWFHDVNFAVHDDPRVRIFPADGRNFLLASPRTYDVIISEPSNPWMAGVGSLFTRQYYGLAKQRLAPGGMMCQWLQLYHIFPADVKLVLKTFHAEFPYVSVWSSAPGDLLLVGSMQPQRLPYAELAERMAQPKVKEALAVVRMDDPQVLLELYRMDGAAVDRLTADVPWVHDDDLPWLEFNAPKALYADKVILENLAGIDRYRTPAETLVEGRPATPANAAYQLRLAQALEDQDDFAGAHQALEQAVRLEPSSQAAWLALGRAYYREQHTLAADAALQRATSLGPSAEALRLRGQIRLAQQDPQGAWELLSAAARLAAPDAAAAEELGRCLMQLKRNAEAAECFRSSLSQGLAGPLLWPYGEALTALKQWDGLAALAELGRGWLPGEPIWWLMTGRALYESGRRADAGQAWARAAALAPHDGEAYYWLGRLAQEEGQPALARRMLRRSLSSNPYNPDAAALLQALPPETK